MFRVIIAFVAFFLCFVDHIVVPHALADSNIEEPATGWGKKLNPRGEIPTMGFKAIYIDRKNPDVIVYEETTNSIAINYAYHDFHEIDSPNFGAYWVGKLKFDSDVKKQISISQTWAHSRITIDGKLIFDKENDSATFTYDFSAGEHVIEVEHFNNWHTVEFEVAVSDVVSLTSEDAIASYFQNNKLDEADVYYIGVYESSAPNLTIHVDLPETKKPAVLWLDSYSAVDWILDGPSERVYAVILSSNSPGARVSGKTIDHRFDPKGWVGVHNEGMSCSCMGDFFHCEDKRDILGVAKALHDVTGKELTAYAVNYEADRLTMTPFGQNVIERIRQQRVRNAELKNQCHSKTDTNQ